MSDEKQSRIGEPDRTCLRGSEVSEENLSTTLFRRPVRHKRKTLDCEKQSRIGEPDRTCLRGSEVSEENLSATLFRQPVRRKQTTPDLRYVTGISAS